MPVVQQPPPMVVQGVPMQGVPIQGVPMQGVPIQAMQGLQINNGLQGAQTIPRIVPVQANILGTNATQTLQQPGKIIAQPQQKPGHIPLARCRVLYLGSAVPLDTSHGIDAVQGPCRERYPFESGGDVNGIDSWVSVFSSGMLLSYVNDKKGNTWFPIQSLYVCAAVKCVITVDGVTGDKNARFVSLDSEEAKASKHPPMFTCIMRRTKGVKVLECHVFICKSTKAAMALVQSCTHAYEHKEGWTDEPPSLLTKPNAQTRLVAAEEQEITSKENNAPPEFYQPPPAHGYYYTSDKELVKNYNVFGNEEKEERRAESDYGGRRTAQAPGAPGGPMPVPPTGYYPQPQGPPGGPPMGPPQPPPGSQMYQYGSGYPPMPPPPPGYFNDWDRYAGRPYSIFEQYDTNRYPAPPPVGPIPMGPPPMIPPPGMYEPEVRVYREERAAQPPSSRRDEYRDYRRDDYRPRDEYRVRDEYRGAPPPIREEYRTMPPPRDVYRSEPEAMRYYSSSRGRSPSPPRRGREEIIHEERYRGEPTYDMRRRERTPPRDYRPDRYVEQNRYYEERGRGGREGDRYYSDRRHRQEEETGSDLVLYAPRYRSHLPRPSHSRSVENPRMRSERAGGGGARRVDRGDYVQYTSNFTPEVVMKGSKEYRGNQRGGDRYEPEVEAYDEDPYRYERNIRRSDDDVDYYAGNDRRYPRQERGFGKSLQEERETIGDNFSDVQSAYRQNDMDTESANIDYGYFHGGPREATGRPMADLEDTLGYYP